MQQAARISDYTAFFYMGKVIEYDHTRKIFTTKNSSNGRLRFRTFWLGGARWAKKLFHQKIYIYITGKRSIERH